MKRWDVLQGCTTLATIDARTASAALQRFRQIVKFGRYSGPPLSGAQLRAVPA